MRILHVVPTYLPATRYGGTIFSVHGMCKGLAERGHEVHVFTTNVDGPGDSDVPLEQPVPLDGARVWYFPSPRLRRLYWSPAMARALAREMPGFDLVHLHSVFLWPTLYAARMARTHAKPYLITPHGMLYPELIVERSPWLKRAWISLFERRNIEHASAIHLTVEAEAQALHHFGFRLPRLTVIPNGVDQPEDVDEQALSEAVRRVAEHGKLILFLSRVHWKKGLDRLVQAMAHIPDAHLAIAGNDEENYLETLLPLADACGVRQRITVLGPVQGADKAFLFRRAMVTVLPSAYPENFGIVVLEALSHGCPVVVTPEVGLAGWVSETDAGLVSQGEPRTLASAISSLLDDPARRRRMTSAGPQRVLEQFGWPTVARQIEAVYRQITPQ